MLVDDVGIHRLFLCWTKEPSVSNQFVAPFLALSVMFNLTLMRFMRPRVSTRHLRIMSSALLSSVTSPTTDLPDPSRRA